MPHRLTTIRTFRLSPLGCVGLLLLLAGCGRDRTQSAPDTAIGEATKSASKGDWPGDDRRSHVFVGSQACAECHADLVQRYQSHPMARSMTTPDRLPDHVMAAIPGQVEFGGRSYGVTQDGGEQFQTEKLEDAEGEIYSQQCRVDLAFGSGTHGYTFASIQGNALYQVPLTWYEDIKGWDLSPGYHRPDHDRFERRISDDCVSCHMGRVAPEGHNTNRFGKNFIVEASIGCERCHGPGAEHIDYHSAGVASAAHPDPIVNPARLPVHARESVCFQCHLSGESKVLRAGRSAYDFRPGDCISDIWVTLVNQPATGESVTNSQAVSHVEQMVSSKCYQESAGAFQCTSCQATFTNGRACTVAVRCIVTHFNRLEQSALRRAASASSLRSTPRKRGAAQRMQRLTGMATASSKKAAREGGDAAITPRRVVGGQSWSTAIATGATAALEEGNDMPDPQSAETEFEKLLLFLRMRVLVAGMASNRTGVRMPTSSTASRITEKLLDDNYLDAPAKLVRAP